MLVELQADSPNAMIANAANDHTENLVNQGPLDDQHVNQSEYEDRFDQRVLSFHVGSICVVYGSPLFESEHIPKVKVLELAISKVRDIARC